MESSASKATRNGTRYLTGIEGVGLETFRPAVILLAPGKKPFAVEARLSTAPKVLNSFGNSLERLDEKVIRLRVRK